MGHIGIDGHRKESQICILTEGAAKAPWTLPRVAEAQRLTSLAPRTLAVMHGSSHSGAAAPALESLAAFYDDRLRSGAGGKPDGA